MQWSQLKKQLQTRMAESISGGIDMHQTRYRHSHDQEGEFWITLGKSRIFSSGSLSYLSSLGKLAAKHRDEGASPVQAFDRAWTTTEANGVMLSSQTKFIVNAVPKPFIKDSTSLNNSLPFSPAKRRQKYLACFHRISMRFSSGL